MQPLVTLPHISKNVPLSQKHLDTFPPNKYPLCLSVSFSRKAVGFRKHLKAVLDTIPKDKIKYRSCKRISTTFNCYCHSVNALAPVLNDALGQTRMYARYGLIPDKQIFPDDLWTQGKQILSTLELRNN